MAKNFSRFFGGMMLVMMVVLAAVGCSAQPTPSAGAVTIRFAALPIVDALPLYVAQKDGLFAKHGIVVEFIPAASAAERDQIISAGQADAMINDLVSVALYNRETPQVQIVRFARVASVDSAMYRILATKDSGFSQPVDLAGVPIGMSQGTVIDYVTSRLLEKEGLSADQIQSIAVPKMNERMALLASGEVKAATLPEPFGSMAMQSGAVLITDDSKHPEYGNSVITFRKAFLDANPQAVSNFLAAVDEAVAALGAQSESYRSLLAEYKLVPEAVQANFALPAFPRQSLPTEAQFTDAVEWAKSRDLLQKDVTYTDSVWVKP